MGQSIQAKLSIAILVYACFSLTPTAEASQSHHQYVNRVVDAIYKAEGGRKTSHPYGVLSVKSMDPRRTCFEVVNWRYAIWSGTPSLRKKPFLEYLGSKYAPRHVKNDPTDLNRYWVKNVTYFMGRGK